MENPVLGQPDRLAHPVRLTEQNWPEGTVPTVSILCITYNHEKFISECLDGFLMQETTFPVEIIVHDDASTDRTPAIVKEYGARYPKLFQLVLQKRNQRSQGRRNMPTVMGLARGEYFAYCDGDDYWTHPHKLETQFRIIATRPDVAMVSHGVALISETTEIWRRAPEHSCIEYCDTDVLPHVFDHSSTWLARTAKLPFEFKRLLHSLSMGDSPINLFLLQNGKKGISLGEVWSIYRQHAAGVWSPLTWFQKQTELLVLSISQKRFYAPRYSSEYKSIIADQRRALTGFLGAELVNLRLRQSLRNLIYLANRRMGSPRWAYECALVLTLAVYVAARLGIKGLFRRAVRKLGVFSSLAANIHIPW